MGENEREEVRVKDPSNSPQFYYAESTEYVANGNVLRMEGVEEDTMFDDKTNKYWDWVEVPTTEVLTVRPE